MDFAGSYEYPVGEEQRENKKGSQCTCVYGVNVYLFLSQGKDGLTDIA